MLKWALRVLITLVVFVVVAVAAVYALGQYKLSQSVTVAQGALAEQLSQGDPKRGAHFANFVVRCTSCHGANGGGELLLQNIALGTISAPNLTRGPGGTGEFGDADWVRALRFGGAPDGRPLLIMPSRDFAELSHGDLADIVAYLRSLPPLSHTFPPPRLGPLAEAGVAFGMFHPDADEIRKDAPMPSNVPPAVSVAYGRYLARLGCMSCHGTHFSGGPMFDGTVAQNLTRSGDLGRWTFEQFKNALRTGRRPDGTSLSRKMPWPRVGQMTDDELHAVYLFLKSTPPSPPVADRHARRDQSKLLSGFEFALSAKRL